VTGERDWRAYEEQIHERLLRLAGADAEIEFDARVSGRLSGVERQVDILIGASFANIGPATMAVDCKCFSRNVDVKSVETVIGLVEDVGADLGLIVTTEGFSEGARRRARAVRGITLDVVPYEDLADWEPDIEWCKVCTDPASERFPGRCLHDVVRPPQPSRGRRARERGGSMRDVRERARSPDLRNRQRRTRNGARRMGSSATAGAAPNGASTSRSTATAFRCRATSPRWWNSVRSLHSPEPRRVAAVKSRRNRATRSSGGEEQGDQPQRSRS